MKKILFAIPIVSLAGLITAAHAGVIGKKKKIIVHERKIKNSDWTNYQTKQQFELDFPSATDVKWYNGNFEEATFKDGAIITTAYYDIDNKLVGTTTEASYSDLPENAQKGIRKNFPGYKVNDVILFKDNPGNDTDMFLYSTPFEDEDSYFAQVGNGIKQAILKINMDGQVSFFQTYKQHVIKKPSR